MAVKLYGPTFSTATARAMLCLEEVGAEYEQISIDFATGEHKSPEHLARNPFGQVPAFQDGDLMIFESRVIGRYVLRKYKSSSGVDLLREDSLAEAAMVDVWLEVEAHHFDKAVSTIIYQTMVVPFFFGGTPDEKVVAEHMEKLEKVLDVYEARLSKSKYLAGDFISLADISHIPSAYLFLAIPEDAKVFEARSHVKAWWDSLTSRPAYKKVTGGSTSDRTFWIIIKKRVVSDFAAMPVE